MGTTTTEETNKLFQHRLDEWGKKIIKDIEKLEAQIANICNTFDCNAELAEYLLVLRNDNVDLQRKVSSFFIEFDLEREKVHKILSRHAEYITELEHRLDKMEKQK